ncbi:MAG: LysR family transcriptional regulator [Polycyclovorans sp.]|jgi:DNA-binding transcriptional LysR family regulator|uniref:LysR family transcriptional regulator n=1 Tax=unclassified Hwanghaeella TaxID=2605944 RepID=UPI000C5895C4|nr:LysR family transcriptional regulator [Rhodospirillales bacterium]MAY24684.1 LysR family transcriptional regulator [Polycyclovorans sp.]|tara:strand:- start:17619 stop:18533 length:915 start_codon:yes stop_codon:yes gene_type:complete
MQDLSGIAVFAAVVEAGSFTAAAEKMGQSKSAVSKQVTRLEQRLGAQLIARTTRRLNLTEVGQAFYERCRRIIAEAEEAELAVTHLQERPRGQLRVTAPVSFGITHLARALPDFMTQFPEVKVFMDFSDRRVDILEEGFDMAVRIGVLEDSSLIAKRIAETRRPILASKDYWDRMGRPEHPKDLEAHNCLIYTYLSAPNSWNFKDPDDPKGGGISVRVGGTLTSNNGNALALAASAGLGIVNSPTFICAESIRNGDLISALDAFEPDPIGIYALYPPNRHLSAKVRAFVDFLVARYSGPEMLWP